MKRSKYLARKRMLDGLSVISRNACGFASPQPVRPPVKNEPTFEKGERKLVTERLESDKRLDELLD